MESSTIRNGATSAVSVNQNAPARFSTMIVRIGDAWALFPGDVAYVWHASLHVHSVAESLMASDFNLRAHIIWAKDRLQLSRGHYHWQHEPCWYAVRNGKAGHWL